MIARGQYQPCRTQSRLFLANVKIPFRRRERAMQRFRSAKTLQKFSSVHAQVHNHFNQERHLITREIYKQRRTAALASRANLRWVWVGCDILRRTAVSLTKLSVPRPDRRRRPPSRRNPLRIPRRRAMAAVRRFFVDRRAARLRLRVGSCASAGEHNGFVGKGLVDPNVVPAYTLDRKPLLESAARGRSAEPYARFRPRRPLRRFRR